MAQTSSLESYFKGAFWNQMQKVHTSIPCIVIDIQNDLNEQRVSVQPSIDILNEDGTTRQRPVIVNVPVVFPASSISAVTFPITKGDTVLCLFSMRAMEIFSEGDGRPAPPNNLAKFNVKDAIAIPGLMPRRNAVNNPNKRTWEHSTQDTVIAHNIGTAQEVEIRLKPDGNVIINSPSLVKVNCQTAEINAEQSASISTPQLNIDATTTNWTGDINITGDINQSGTLTASVDVIGGGKSLSTHTHGGVQSGGSNTTPPN